MARAYRKIWHLLGGSFFPVFAMFFPAKTVLIFCLSVFAVVVGVEAVRLVWPRFNRWFVGHLGFMLKGKEAHGLTGTTYLLISTLLSFYFFDKWIAICALLFLSVGDFCAVLVGEKFGRMRVFGKTLEGSLACLSSCLAVATAIWLLDRGLGDGQLSLLVFFVGAIAATLVELFPLPLDDNLTVPLLSALSMLLASLLLK